MLKCAPSPHIFPWARHITTSLRFLSTYSYKSKLYYKMATESKSHVLNASSRDIYFGREVLNRVSFLREEQDFISNAVTHPSTRFIFYSNGDPLVNKAATNEKLVILTNGDNQMDDSEAGAATTKGLVSEPQWSKTIETWSEDNKEQHASLRDDKKPTFLFLGLKDESVGLDLQQLKCQDGEKYLDYQGRYFGIPYFGVDVSDAPQVGEIVKNHIASAEEKVAADNLIFSYSRKHTLGFTGAESALFSHGKMYFDWLNRNRFCPGCGTKVIPVHAGGKLKCTNDTVVEETEKNTVYACPVKNTRVSNVSFPRTDAVVIIAITNKDRSKVLLSLNKRYAFTKMYSCTAGFVEPSETIEVAAKREIWEETGVICSDIHITMTQPWPFPGNLMIGCVATVEFNGDNEVIHLGHDQELADARWFDASFVRKLLHGVEDDETLAEGIVLPSDVSVAHALILEVVDAKAKL